jgi:hypothetical protein
VPAVAVVLLVRPETAGELARSALSVAQQDTADWELAIVHRDDPDLRAAASDLARGDSRIAGAASVPAALAGNSGAVICWLESGARFPAGYLSRIAAALADPTARITVAARSIEHGHRFGQSDRVLPDSPSEPALSQLAVRRADAERDPAELLRGPGRRNLPDLAVATRFGEPPRVRSSVTVVAELHQHSPGLSVRPQLAALLDAGFPVVVAASGPARLAGPAALGRLRRRAGLTTVSGANPSAARLAALDRVDTALVAFVPAGWEIGPVALSGLGALLEERDAAAVMPVARDAGGSILGAGLIWADQRSLPQRLLAGHPFTDIADRRVEVPAPHPEGLLLRVEDARAGLRDDGVPAPWWPLPVLHRAGRGGPILVDGRHDIAIPRFTPPGANRVAPKRASAAVRRAVEAAAPPEPVSASRAALAAAGWKATGVAATDGDSWRTIVARPATRVEPVPQRRWALKIGAPPGERGDSWGDVFFAEDLARALRALGNDVVIDRDGSAGRTGAYLDRVVLNLRGYQVVHRQPGSAHLLWVISHPDQVSTAEMREYDRVYAASATWPDQVRQEHGVDVQPMLQATDPARFHPDVADPDTGPDLLFVGNSKNEYRPIIADCRAAGLRPTVIGRGWEKFLPAEEIAALEVSNEQLPAVYRSAGIVLNDHWDDMVAKGFLNNRLFDAVACGARIVSDDVRGLREVFGDAVAVYRTPQDLAQLCNPANRAAFGSDAERRERAAAVAAQHSFAARAERLMADASVLQLLPE